MTTLTANEIRVGDKIRLVKKTYAESMGYTEDTLPEDLWTGDEFLEVISKWDNSPVFFFSKCPGDCFDFTDVDPNEPVVEALRQHHREVTNRSSTNTTHLPSCNFQHKQSQSPKTTRKRRKPSTW